MVRFRGDGFHREGRARAAIKFKGGVVGRRNQNGIPRVRQAKAQVLEHGVAARADDETVRIQPSRSQAAELFGVRGERGPQFGAARCGLVVNGVGVQLLWAVLFFFIAVVVECGDEPVFEQLRFGDAQLERAVGVAGRVSLHGSGVGEIGR